jgi:hypothetical protein
MAVTIVPRALRLMTVLLIGCAIIMPPREAAATHKIGHLADDVIDGIKGGGKVLDDLGNAASSSDKLKAVPGTAPPPPVTPSPVMGKLPQGPAVLAPPVAAKDRPLPPLYNDGVPDLPPPSYTGLSVVAVPQVIKPPTPMVNQLNQAARKPGDVSPQGVPLPVQVRPDTPLPVKPVQVPKTTVPPLPVTKNASNANQAPLTPVKATKPLSRRPPVSVTDDLASFTPVDTLDEFSTAAVLRRLNQAKVLKQRRNKRIFIGVTVGVTGVLAVGSVTTIGVFAGPVVVQEIDKAINERTLEVNNPSAQTINIVTVDSDGVETAIGSVEPQSSKKFPFMSTVTIRMLLSDGTDAAAAIQLISNMMVEIPA